jgi:GINS complex subunit 4
MFQIELIEDLTASSFDTASNYTNTTRTANNQNVNLNLKLSILQTDLSRTQYLIRSLLRQRLAKLTRYSMHYLILISPPSQQQSQSSSTQQQLQPEDTVPDPFSSPEDSSFSPLSPKEAEFLHAHQTLLASHHGSSFLGSFPPQLRRLDDNAGGTSMVQAPDARQVVFVRCLAEEVTVVIPPDDAVREEEYGTTMRIGEVWVARWEGVRKAWERGEVEIL